MYIHSFMVIERLIERLSYERNVENNLRTWRNIKKKSKWPIIGIIGATLLSTSLYTVKPDSMGVVRRFGEFNRSTRPGLHLKMPYGIEKVKKVPVTKIQKEEFGFRTLKSGVDSEYLGISELEKGTAKESDLIDFVKDVGLDPEGNREALYKQGWDILKAEYLMLTGDLNMADVEWVVQYQIKDPVAYSFNIRDPTETIRDASQAVMRRIIGNGSVDEAITIGRIETEGATKQELQDLLDEYQTGIHVVTVKLQSTNPPLKVRPAFNMVNESMQQKEQKINEAMQEYNRVIPKAKGEAKREIETAKGYAIARVNEATGDVDKFLEVLKEYKKAPEITEQRLYLETMTRVLPNITEKTIVDDKGLESGFYRMFNLDMKGEK